MFLVAFASCVWFFAGGSWIIATLRDADRQATDVVFDVFLQPDVTDSSGRALVRTLRLMPNIASASLKDANSVWKEFSTEVGIGEELQSIVDVPSIIRCKLKPNAVHETDALLLAAAIERQYPQLVKEVVWPKQLVALIDARRQDVVLLGSAAGALSIVLFIFALAYAFRAEIHRAGEDLRVGVVLGASPVSIAMPHVVVSCTAGFLGLAIAYAVVLAAGMNLGSKLTWIRLVSPTDLGLMSIALACVGILVCWQQSVHAVYKAEAKGH